MKIINSSLHAILDYIGVLLLVCAPLIFGFSQVISLFNFSLGGIHLILTVLTDFRGGLVKIIPFRIHGVVELSVSFALFLFTLFFPFQFDAEFYFYLFFSFLVFIIWLLTDYTPQSRILL